MYSYACVVGYHGAKNDKFHIFPAAHNWRYSDVINSLAPT